ncbi:hypothetical protein ZWY2020_053953 [Hordeum vulgare]|nr:hypothetical protein ZWY2020_053953 [Hordeum vulgare]
MVVDKCTVALLVAVALVAGPAVSYAAEAGYAPAEAQPKATTTTTTTTEEQELIDKANNAFKAALAAAAPVPPADKYKTFQTTFTHTFGILNPNGFTDPSGSNATFRMRIYYAKMFAYEYNITKDATPEAKYDSFVAVFNRRRQIEPPAWTPSKKDKSTIFDSAFSKAIKDTMDGAYQGYKFVPALESGVKEAYSLLLPQRPQNKLMVFEAVLRETILAMAAGATAPATPATDAAATATPTPTPATAAGGNKV